MMGRGGEGRGGGKRREEEGKKTYMAIAGASAFLVEK